MRVNRFIVGVFVFVLSAGPTWAIPTLSFDLDTAVSGIQSARNVLPGSTFTVAMVLSNYDTTTLFDTVSFDLHYNDSGMVLTGVGRPLAGALVDMSTTQTWDTFAGLFVDIDALDTLATLDLGIAPGYLSHFDYFAYSSITDPFNLTGPDPITVAWFNLTASALGTSSLFMAVAPAALSFQGNPVDVTLGSARINVISTNAVPEPGIVWLLGAGLIGLGVSRSRQRHQQ